MALVVILVVVVADVDVVTCAQRAEQSARLSKKALGPTQTGPGRAHVIAVNLYKVTKNSYTAIPTHTHTYCLSLSLSITHKQASRAKGLGIICRLQAEARGEGERQGWHTKHMLNFVLDVFFNSI